MFIHFDRIHERDKQTDRQTPCDGIGCAYAQSHTTKMTDSEGHYTDSLCHESEHFRYTESSAIISHAKLRNVSTKFHQFISQIYFSTLPN